MTVTFFLPFISWLIIGLGSKSTLLPVILSSSPPRQFVNLGIVLGGELYRDSPASHAYVHTYTHIHDKIRIFRTMLLIGLGVVSRVRPV